MICPLCNGLTTESLYCPVCRRQMLNGGRIEDYLDDYSPFMEYHNYYRGYCQHVFYCPSCQYEIRENIPTKNL